MTQLQALKELAVKVEAGEHGNQIRAFGDLWAKSSSAYRGSLDAAKALHEAVIDDYSFLVGMDWAEVWLPFGSEAHKFNIGNTTPARAWLIAIIRAKISELEAK